MLASWSSSRVRRRSTRRKVPSGPGSRPRSARGARTPTLVPRCGTLAAAPSSARHPSQPSAHPASVLQGQDREQSRHPCPAAAGQAAVPRPGASPGASSRCRRGTCRTIKFLPVAGNPQAGPAFQQATPPVASAPACRLAGASGRTLALPSSSRRRPSAVFIGRRHPRQAPAAAAPARAGILNSGAPLRNPQAGPVFRLAVQPAG